MVEHDLAKVGVASSSLVSRSKLPDKAPERASELSKCPKESWSLKAGWQSGYAADCNSVYAGSIPTPASNFLWFKSLSSGAEALHFPYTYARVRGSIDPFFPSPSPGGEIGRRKGLKVNWAPGLETLSVNGVKFGETSASLLTSGWWQSRAKPGSLTLPEFIQFQETPGKCRDLTAPAYVSGQIGIG